MTSALSCLRMHAQGTPPFPLVLYHFVFGVYCDNNDCKLCVFYLYIDAAQIPRVLATSGLGFLSYTVICPSKGVNTIASLHSFMTAH